MYSAMKVFHGAFYTYMLNKQKYVAENKAIPCVKIDFSLPDLQFKLSLNNDYIREQHIYVYIWRE